MISSIELVGHFAAFCTTVSFLPQAIKVVRTKDTASLSLSMYLLFSIGVLCWLIYGILIAKAPLIIPNIITLILAITILSIKIASVLKEKKVNKI